MEYNSAMKTNVIGDTTQINLEVNINKQKKKTAKNKTQKAVCCTLPFIQYSQMVYVKR